MGNGKILALLITVALL